MAGAHPKVMERLLQTNAEQTVGYGCDDHTLRAKELVKQACKAPDARVYFLVGGTQTNSTVIDGVLAHHEGVLAAESGHINVHESGAIEATGHKVLTLPSYNGKVKAEDVKLELYGYGDQHHAQPRILSISQPTELGTCYTTDEIKELADLMHNNGGYLHIDGSRISNAAAYMNKSVKEITVDCGADALSFGGTKNGLLMGEAVVIFNNTKNAHAANSIKYIRKQTTQLFSKSRFIAAQFEAYLKDGFNIKLATASNQMAQYLANSIKDIKEVKISQPVESNAVFAIIPKWLTEELQKKHYFYVWNENTNEVRWMCSFNTTKEDIDAFVNDIKELTK
jgi:threonine aldolase